MRARTSGHDGQDIRTRGPGHSDMRPGHSDMKTGTFGHEGQDIKDTKSSDIKDGENRTFRTDESSDIEGDEGGQTDFERVRCRVVGSVNKTIAPDSRPVTAVAEKRNHRARPSAGESRVGRWICGGTRLSKRFKLRTKGHRTKDRTSGQDKNFGQ